jgi:D-amino-acid dehydrogenase
VSPGYSAPWAGPGVPVKAIKWMLMQHSPLVIWPMLDPAMWRWGAMMLANCTERAYALNKSRMVPIAEYSRDCLKALRAEVGIAYDDRAQGTLQLFRTQKQLDGIGQGRGGAAAVRRALRGAGPRGLLPVEPALKLTQEKFVGALRLPATRPATASSSPTAWPRWRRAGREVPLRHAHPGAAGRRRRITGVRTDAGAAEGRRAWCWRWAAFARSCCAPLGIRIPVYPVKGYSITVPITDAAGAPESTIMDETHKVAVTRLGDRIRVGGTAELAGYSLLREPRRATLEHVVTDLFPRGGDVARPVLVRPAADDARRHAHRRPTPYANLLLATGHGTLGWTMAAGTGRVMADLVSGRHPLRLAPGREGAGAGDRLHAAARRWQVRQGRRRRLQLQRRPARCGRERDQCAGHGGWPSRCGAKGRPQHWCLAVAM